MDGSLQATFSDCSVRSGPFSVSSCFNVAMGTISNDGFASDDKTFNFCCLVCFRLTQQLKNIILLSFECIIINTHISTKNTTNNVPMISSVPIEAMIAYSTVSKTVDKIQ